MLQMSSTQFVHQVATLMALLFATSRSQSCSTIVHVQSLPSGLARATQLSVDEDVSVIIGQNWNVSDAECVEIQFSSGLYRTTQRGVNVTSNVVLSSSDSDVTIACTVGYNDDSSYLYRFSKGQGSVKVLGISFVNCTASLKFENLTSLKIINSTFSNFTASPLNIFNCWHVNITNSIFASSKVAVAGEIFHGDSGGISIAYKSVKTNSLDSPPYLRVANCTFKQNTAYLPYHEAKVHYLVTNYTYTGRGGGMAIVISEDYYNITVSTDGCTFVDNTAGYSGGALYFSLRGKNTHHVITVSNCLFEGNSAVIGGATHVGFATGYSATQFTAIGCTYRNNQADYGGAISTLRQYEVGLQGNWFSLIDTMFEANSGNEAGSAAAFFSYQYPFNLVKPYPHLINNCTYINNRSPQGALLTSFVDLDLQGTIYFGNNSGAALMNIGSLITVNGSILFVGNVNSAVGGALYIMEFGQMRMLKGSKMEFINNVGSIGAAIVVMVQEMSPAFSLLQYNPQCFLVFEDLYSPLSDHNVTVLFQGNRARVGAAIYISSLQSCSWINSTHEMENYDLKEFPNWSAFKFMNNTNTDHTNQSKAFDVQTEATQLYAVSVNDTHEAEVYPGQSLNLSIIANDQFNNPTSVIAWLRAASVTNLTDQDIIADADSSNAANESVVLDPALLQILPNEHIVTIVSLIRQLNFTPNDTVSLIVNAPYNIRDVPLKSEFDFYLTIKNCKPGYQLDQSAHGTSYMCMCVNDNEVLACEEEEGTIILQDGYWAGVVELSISPSQLIFLPCPAGYCSCRIQRPRREVCSNVFFQTDIDNLQCHSTRKGLLCGECRDGLSVGILRPNCRNCTVENTKFSIAILAFADVFLTMAVLFVSVKYQVVFPASLKGFLFYIQTIYWSTEFVPASWWDIRQYLLYVNSALSLYFPWDFCSHPGAKALEMAALKFITPIIVTITTVAVFSLFKRWRGRMWNGIVTLILLLYPSLVHNCASLLHCKYISDGNSYEQRWYQDGSVRCYGDWLHTVLGVVSIMFLPLLGAMILFIILVVVYTSIKAQQQEDTRFYNLSKAFSKGYKDTTAWWYPVDLLRRYLLLVVLPFFPGKTVISLLLVMAATAAHAFIQPYSVAWHNHVETALLGYYVALLLFNSSTDILSYLTENIYTSIPVVPPGVQDYGLTWVFATLFYAPLALAVIACCLLLLRAVYSNGCCKRSRIVSSKAIQGQGYVVDTFPLPVSGTVINFDGSVDLL